MKFTFKIVIIFNFMLIFSCVCACDQTRPGMIGGGRVVPQGPCQVNPVITCGAVIDIHLQSHTGGHGHQTLHDSSLPTSTPFEIICCGIALNFANKISFQLFSFGKSFFFLLLTVAVVNKTNSSAAFSSFSFRLVVKLCGVTQPAPSLH